jgi:hypothetical protein
MEQFSSLDVKTPRNILSHHYSRLHRLIALAQIAERKKLVEPAEVSIKKKMKCISWIKNTLAFMMIKFRNVLSAISTYLKLHIWIKIH